MTSTARSRRRLVISGIVQGVGFRPAMHRAATARGLDGFVGNDGHGVFVEIEGPADVVDDFVAGLAGIVPPLAAVDGIAVTMLAPLDESGFRIVESVPGSGSPSTLVLPDVAPCADCLAELHDPADRRHRYPFLNCTNCGPRYSIVVDLPYDRPRTTMAGFTMCAACAAEYVDPDDRRYHAQPTCCPACGPRLTLRDAAFAPIAHRSVVDAVVKRVAGGDIVAVKGVGGYHLVVDAGNDAAVRRLRERKHRDEKPFALLVADVDAARAVADVSPVEADLLVSPERPIVLLGRRDSGAGPRVAPSVAPGNRALGVLLPPSPLHVLLAESAGRPLVLTSANRSSEPIVHRDDDAAERLAGIADWFCTHDRPIHVRIDDSVTRVVGDGQIVVRRARGHAPRPVRIAGGFPRHTLACGAELKATVCVGRDELAVVSQALGDLEDHETSLAYDAAVEHLCHLFSVRPDVIAHDLHPGFHSTSFALDLAAELDVDTVAVQHHHAHVAACLADNERDEPVLGVAFDGMGFGPDGTAWGGELLLADLTGFRRLGHLRPVGLPGGDAAVRQPWRMALSHLTAAAERDGAMPPAGTGTTGSEGGASGWRVDDLDVYVRNQAHWSAVASLIVTQLHTPLTSSAGRLFDAVAAVLGVRDEVSYEGQAAIELEQLARSAPTNDAPAGLSGRPPLVIDGGVPFVVDASALVVAAATALSAGGSRRAVAAAFHAAVVDAIVAMCRRGRDETGLDTVALSGGVFQNVLLVRGAVGALAADGFEVLTHRRFPPNDGGISLGQAAIVAARDRAAG